MSRRHTINVPPGAYRSVELIQAGVHSKRLGANDVRRIGRGIVLHPNFEYDDFSYRDRCIAVGMTLRQEFFLPQRAPRHRLIDGHRVKSGILQWTENHGLTLPSASDIWCQLGPVTTLAGLVAAGDFLISGARIRGAPGGRAAPLCSLEELRHAHQRHRTTVGGPLRTRALALLRAPVDSPPESFLRIAIILAGFEEPKVNCPVPTRARTFHADLGYPELRIAIEYEGRYHFSSPDQARFDLQRRRSMVEAGWTVLQVLDSDVDDPHSFFVGLGMAIEAARAHLG
ncbi:hypothetical protein [Leucobacter manosquensis]|uniref:DUF559 domain-containing protein n=1 Tax=Leucobacter manosquensis TaxID=2810611 RepID=A0ABS5M6G5_9MICO|nr:hypothetical protein [Leucobacter manosquensis]MBS3182789.1 hypothetical protein [Leucobacter manosquensis]